MLSRLHSIRRAIGWVRLRFLPCGEMFGEERPAELVCWHAHLNEDQIVDAVWKGVREWSGDGELADDMTLLLARRL